MLSCLKDAGEEIEGAQAADTPGCPVDLEAMTSISVNRLSALHLRLTLLSVVHIAFHQQIAHHPCHYENWSRIEPTFLGSFVVYSR